MKRRIDPDLGEIMMFPGYEKYPLAVGTLDWHKEIQPYKRAAHLGIVALHRKFRSDIDNLVPRKMCPFTRSFYDAFDLFISMLKPESMRVEFTRICDLFCLFAQSDDSYRLLMQAFFYLLDPEKFRLTEADWFWLRTKGYFDLDAFAGHLEQRQSSRK